MNMGAGLGSNNPVIVSAFHRALLHQGFIVLFLAVAVMLAWNVARAAVYRRAVATSAEAAAAPTEPAAGTEPATSFPSTVAATLAAEPSARRLLRLSFGLLWMFDGILQGQAAMPAGLISHVVQPAAASSPGWVQHLVGSVTQVWSYHPVTAAAAAVWIQVGIGLWTLVAPRGNWSRLGGVAGAGWALLIWMFGEAFGGVFGSGLSWLTGAPGSALLYALAGVLVALPETVWSDARLGRYMLRGAGVFLAGMAVLQAWPGRGFWTSGSGGSAGPLTAWAQGMAGMPQPALFTSISTWFAGVQTAHAWAVNLVAVVAMAAVAAGLLAPRRRVNRVAVAAAGLLSLVVWVLVQDLGFLGGVGTDPNTAIPFIVLLLVAERATRPAPAVAPAAAAAAPETVSETASATRPAVPAAAGLVARARREPIYAFRAVAATAAMGVTLLGAAPMAVASVRNHADAILSTAVDGPPQAADIPAAPFRLTDQYGRPVSLSSLAGKVVAMTFLDPVCTNDCPIVAQEFRQADGLLGADRSKVVMVAVDANPAYTNRAFLDAFDQQEHLAALPNWEYLTGTPAQLAAVWKNYGVEIQLGTGGAMVDHSDLAFVLSADGRTRWVLDATPGPGTTATQSSFAATLADTVRKVIAGP